MSVTLRPRTLKSGKKSLYLDVYENGRRRQEMLGLYLTGDRGGDKETMRLAEAVRAKRVLDLQHGRYGFTPAYKRRSCFVDLYREVAVTKTHKNWQSALNHLEAYTRGAVPIEAVDEAWLEGLQRFLLGRVKPNTAHLYYAKVKATLNEAVRRRIIPSNPAGRVKNIKKEEPEVVFLEFEEVQRLAAAECRHDGVRRAFLFSCYTGLRVSDVRALRWRHVRGRQLHFRQKKTRGRVYPPLSDQARRLMGPRQSADAAVFDLPKCENTVNKILREWAAQAGIEKHIYFHVSRHTFATLQLSFGTDIYTVSSLCGHRELRSTQIYAKVIDAVREEAVSRIPALIQ